MQRLIISLGSAVLCMALSGCATVQQQFRSEVDSLAKSVTFEKKRYVLLPGNKDTEATDLQFQEFSGYIDKVLLERGYIKTNEFSDADLAIFLAYAIGDPQTYHYSYSVPTWGRTGVSSSNTYGTVSSYGGTATYSGTTRYTPTYGVTGATTHVATNTIFTRFLWLDAYDIDSYLKDKKMDQVWKTTVISTGISNDLRLVIPYMVTSMKKYLGSNTGQKVRVDLSEDDPEVQQLRGLPSGRK